MTLPDDSELESWVRATAGGDRAAFDRLYAALLPRILAYARRVLPDEAAAEDCAAETFIQVWRDAARYDLRRGCVAAWVYTICRTRAFDLLRTRRRQGHLAEAVQREQHGQDCRFDEDLIAAFDAGRAVHPLLLRLSPEQRRLVGLAFFQGLSHSEIAAATGMPLGTVKSHIHRALTAMREELGTGVPDVLRQTREVING